jgi:hypothetical protein
VLCELGEIRQRVEDLAGSIPTGNNCNLPPHPGSAETELLAALLPAIAAEFGERVFTTGDLFAAGERNPELKLVLVDIGGSNRTGRLLRAARDHVFAGHVVQAVGESGCGVVWRLVTSGRHIDR